MLAWAMRCLAFFALVVSAVACSSQGVSCDASEGPLGTDDDLSRALAFTGASSETENFLEGLSLRQLRQIKTDSEQEEEEVLIGDEVCVHPPDLSAALRESSAQVIRRGLPPWPHGGKKFEQVKQSGSVRLAFLVQVSVGEKLTLMRRTFDKLYNPSDMFLYLVDSKRLSASRVKQSLGLEGPRQRYLPNVLVRAAPHAGYYYWPRVQVVLDGIKQLQEHPWDFVIHLSESDYPVHSLSWIRRSLAQQRGSSFIKVWPRCVAPTGKADVDLMFPDLDWSRPSEDKNKPASSGGSQPSASLEQTSVPRTDDWYWWTVKDGIASCGGRFEPRQIKSASFPMEELEESGFVFAHSPEWVVLTRELAEYATGPGLGHFKRLIGMHTAADEIFWATLVLNIPNFTQKISKQGWYIRWTPGGTGHSPELLTEHHFDHISEQRSLYLFMRKVEEGASNELMRHMDSASEAEEADGGGVSSLQVADLDLHLDPASFRCRPPRAPVVPPSFPSPAPPSLSALE